MSGTVTGLDLTEIEAAASDLLGVCSEAGYRECVDILVTAVPALLTAARAVQRVEALCDEAERIAAAMGRDITDEGYPAWVEAEKLRAALGTEQEGRTE